MIYLKNSWRKSYEIRLESFFPEKMRSESQNFPAHNINNTPGKILWFTSHFLWKKGLLSKNFVTNKKWLFCQIFYYQILIFLTFSFSKQQCVTTHQKKTSQTSHQWNSLFWIFKEWKSKVYQGYWISIWSGQTQKISCKT